MNRNNLGIFAFCFLISLTSLAQIPKKRLPQNINRPNYSHIFPSLSGDGNQLIFFSNYTNSEGFEAKYSVKTGLETWEDPEFLTGLNRTGLDHIGSFCLSHDGNILVFASRRSPTIGNYDLFISEKIGEMLSEPNNLGKPLNTPSNEGNPSLSPDGKSIYFMRCQTMDNLNKNNCALYVSQRSGNSWSEAVALPEGINTGHETTPRILADNKTLIFASGRAGGQGMLDLYMTVKEDGKWSVPNPLTYFNTPLNDEYISIPARGDIIYYSAPYRDDHSLFMAAIPEAYRPEKVLMLTGSVAYADGQNPSEDVLIQAFDVATGELYSSTKLRQSDNSYTIFLPEGTVYDVSAFPQKGGHTFAGQLVDLQNMNISRKEEWPINLADVKKGTIVPLNTIRYERYSAELADESEMAIKRIVGFLKKNQGVKIEVGAFIDKIYQDTIPSKEMTEVVADTVFIELKKEDLDGISNAFVEDEASQDNDGLDIKETGPAKVYLSPRDSLLEAGYQLLEETRESDIFYSIRYSFHNDRTQHMADTIVQKLLDAGVPADMLSAKGYGDQWTKDLAKEERNYWIELKLTE